MRGLEIIVLLLLHPTLSFCILGWIIRRCKSISSVAAVVVGYLFLGLPVYWLLIEIFMEVVFGY